MWKQMMLATSWKSNFRLKLRKVKAVTQALGSLRKAATYQQACKGKERASDKHITDKEEAELEGEGMH
ncbi:hypothetical protein FRC12_009518 [Ceratobasidium sp. 428]|nr:hypothetical protein FRC12_009518 [Ceratobasidium sp. 428]